MRKSSRSAFRENSNSPTAADSSSSSSSAFDEGQIRCICGAETDDGFTIQCESCLVWQHASCVGIGKTNIPEKYFCEICAPPTFSLHKQREANVENFVKTEKLLLNHEGKDNICKWLQENCLQVLRKAKALSLHVYCPLSLEPLKISCSSSLPPERNSTIAKEKTNGSFPPFFFIKPIKSRGYQRRGIVPKFGIFSKIHLEPGRFLCEFTGEAKMKESFRQITLPSNCLQTFVLFIQNTPIAIDARTTGNLSRFIRRSCRPNVQIELTVNCSSDDSLLLLKEHPFSIRLLAMNNIYEGEEILLPNDFEFGNFYFKYDCACGNPEFCLSSCLFGSFIFNGSLAVSEATKNNNNVKEKSKVHSSFQSSNNSISNASLQANLEKKELKAQKREHKSSNSLASTQEEQNKIHPSAVSQDDENINSSDEINHHSLEVVVDTGKMHVEQHQQQQQQEEEEAKTIVDILSFAEEGEEVHASSQDSTSIENGEIDVETCEEVNCTSSSNQMINESEEKSSSESNSNNNNNSERQNSQQDAIEETSPVAKVKLSLSDYIKQRKTNNSSPFEHQEKNTIASEKDVESKQEQESKQENETVTIEKEQKGTLEQKSTLEQQSTLEQKNSMEKQGNANHQQETLEAPSNSVYSSSSEEPGEYRNEDAGEEEAERFKISSPKRPLTYTMDSHESSRPSKVWNSQHFDKDIQFSPPNSSAKHHRHSLQSNTHYQPLEHHSLNQQGNLNYRSSQPPPPSFSHHSHQNYHRNNNQHQHHHQSHRYQNSRINHSSFSGNRFHERHSAPNSNNSSPPSNSSNRYHQPHSFSNNRASPSHYHSHHSHHPTNNNNSHYNSRPSNSNYEGSQNSRSDK